MQNETPAQTAAAFRSKAAELRTRAHRYGGSDAFYLSRAEKYERWAADADKMAVIVAPAAKVEAVKVEAKPVTKPRCPHYKDIKTFMAIAREHGLDTNAKDRCRGAVGVLLGRRIETRADLEAYEWVAMGAAIKAGKLCW